MRMVVGVDEAWDDELAGPSRFRPPSLAAKLGAMRSILLAADQNIGLLGLMYVTVMVIDPAPADQNGRDLSATSHFVLLPDLRRHPPTKNLAAKDLVACT